MVLCVVCVIVVLINSVGHCDGLPLRCVLLFSLVFWMICVMLFCGVVCMGGWFRVFFGLLLLLGVGL